MQIISKLRLLPYSMMLSEVAKITTLLYRSNQSDKLPEVLFDRFAKLVPVHIDSYIGDTPPVNLDEYPMHLLKGTNLIIDPIGDCTRDSSSTGKLRPWVYSQIDNSRFYLSMNGFPATLKDIGETRKFKSITEYAVVHAILHSPFKNVRCVELHNRNNYAN